MKFGVREICDVVLRAKNRVQIGNKIFYKHEPVIYFDTLKTSSMEGQATQVYANGGRGNPRLVSWEGERTVTFTMEDALISAEGFMILSGAGLIEASADKPIYQHVTETIDRADLPESSFDEKGKLRSGVTLRIPLSQKPYLPTNKGDNFCYVMFKRDGDIITEPYIPTHEEDIQLDADTQKYWIEIPASHPCYDDVYVGEELSYAAREFDSINFDSILIDYYVARTAATKQIEITPDQFGCNFYLEAQTLFRNTNGVDMPAEFIIPNCKIQSNFTFTMASSGDPSSFTFTMDAFPDYTRFDHSKKVFAAIQIIEDANAIDIHRGATPNGSYDATGIVEDANVHEDIWGGPRG